MAIEVELKYSIDKVKVMEQIFEDDSIKKIAEKESRETVFMKAAYFDTEDYILSRNDIAFRVRMEGNKTVASLKWNDQDVEEKIGLHRREEINVPIDDSACFICPDPTIFKESDVGKELLKLLDGSHIESILETRFLRNRIRVDTGKTICEISIDEGEIFTPYGSEPIRELEIELFSGDVDELISIGDELSKKYELIPESRSKYARGLSLIKSGMKR